MGSVAADESLLSLSEPAPDDLASKQTCQQHELPPFSAMRMAELSARFTSGTPAGPEDCRKIAGMSAGSMTRLPGGLMEEWELWREQHPHRDAAVEVHVGLHSRFARRDAEVSVVSWNTLSRTWLEKCRGSFEYCHVPAECFDWSRRSQQLVAILIALDADVILLQEVDFEVFETSFQGLLSEAGYEGLMQNAKNRTEEQPCGNATFWKRDRLQLAWTEHRSRTLVTGLRLQVGLNAGRELAFINAHLESSQAKSEARASQLHSALGKVCSTKAVILGGDFNTGADSPLNAVLRSLQWHDHALAAAYEHPAGETTAQASDCTFAANGGKRYSIDHIIYSHRMLRPTALLDALPQDLRAVCLGVHSKGLPDACVPSDHIPVGTVFELLPASDVSLCRSLPETREEEDLVWSSSSNILTTEQQHAWQLLCCEGSRKCKGKPTPEEIQALKEQKQQRLVREREFVASLSEEARTFLKYFKDGRTLLKRVS
eukprot:TRINITY_DN65560_c0_g1_i1.p1 TRINITY_DN65560_c0_g1~~TRINITY_DN65560_c0_g1_i1.p1  ORF type:complete len:487 (+),score=69.67 TRINITY_DN65560_c0_g1_i1:94-1554(+)